MGFIESATVSAGIDYLVVGAGVAGLTCAQQLSEHGKKVVCIDKRPYVGGNCADYYNEDGVLVHRFGPHMFHTNSRKVYNYLSRFTEWIPGQYKATSISNGQEYCFPPNLRTYEQWAGRLSNSQELTDWLESVRLSCRARNFEEAMIAKVGRKWYQMFYEGYTRKMWGVEPTALLPELAGRIPLRTDYQDSYFTDQYQLMPAQGYTRMFERMAAAKNLFVILNCVQADLDFTADHIIWTGAIDDYFDDTYGHLPYRTLDFYPTTYYNQEFHQSAVLKLFPSEAEPYTRAVEVKHITGQKSPHTTVVLERPRQYEGGADERLYPMPTEDARAQYKRYELAAEKWSDRVTFLGRLGKYAYLNIDQACAQALATAERLLKQ